MGVNLSCNLDLDVKRRVDRRDDLSRGNNQNRCAKCIYSSPANVSRESRARGMPLPGERVGGGGGVLNLQAQYPH